MTEREAIRIINGILQITLEAIKAQREIHKMDTDEFKKAINELKQEASCDENKDSKYRCPCCGTNISSNSIAPNNLSGIMYCHACGRHYEWKKR